MLIDGNSLTYRAFFALPTDIATASGQVTNAVYGFTSMLLNLLREQRPDRVAVAFDRPEPTFRHEAVPTYKAQRESAPDILRQQMGLVREMVAAFGFPIVEAPGYEADDVIATLASAGRDRGDDVLIVTGDRDAYQLVEDPHIKVLYTHSRGVSELKLYDEAGIEERTGVRPAAYVHYAALRGDPSDNLAGVPGVGEKTAAKLINAYGDVDGIYAALEDQTPKLRTNLAEHEEAVRRNVEVMALVRDVPLPVEPDDLVPSDPDADELRRLFAFLEFRGANVLERLEEVLGLLGADPVAVAAEGEVLEPEVAEPGDPAAAVAALAGLADGDGPLALAAEWSGQEGRTPLLGLAVVTDAEAGEVTWLGAEVRQGP